jgi:ADP-glucose pyrophosphorylase
MKEGCGNVLTGALGAVEVDIGHSWRVRKHLDVTCGTFAEASSADLMAIYKNRKWSAEEGHTQGNIFTGDFITRMDIKTRERFAIGQNNNVTCSMFVEASSADWSAKVRVRDCFEVECGNVFTAAIG